MLYEWDGHKNEHNIRERGIDFASAEAFEWPTAIIVEDTRHDYGEERFRAMGFIGEKLHVLVYTMRRERVRIISLRRANMKEELMYEQASET